MMNQELPAEPPKRSGLMVIGILAMALGGLGMVGGVLGMVNPLLQDSMVDQQEQMYRQIGGDQAEMNIRMQREIMEAQKRYTVLTVASQFLNFFASALLGLAGFFLLTKNARGYTFFTAGAGINTVADLFVALGGILVARAQNEVLQRIPEMVGESSGRPVPEGVAEMTGAFASMGMALGMCCAGGWVLLKLTFYLGAVVYVRTPDSRVALGLPPD